MQLTLRHFMSIEHTFPSLSPHSVGSRVQPDRRVLPEALSDRSAAAGTGYGAPGRAGPETLGFVHAEDSNGQALSGCSLCHQGSQNTCLHGRKQSQTMNHEPTTDALPV